MNHLTLHVSFEITCHAQTRNFLSLEERERKKEETGVQRNKKLSQVHSIHLHMSNLGVRGQTAENVCFHTSFLCLEHTQECICIKPKHFRFAPQLVCIQRPPPPRVK